MALVSREHDNTLQGRWLCRPGLGLDTSEGIWPGFKGGAATVFSTDSRTVDATDAREKADRRTRHRLGAVARSRLGS